MIVLPAPVRPRASVVIPAWRRADLLRRCLTALAGHRSASAFETVVVLNGANPEVTALVTEGTAGARIVRARVNLGFGRGCNVGAQAARGEFLVFLNDDTEVQAGWLDALVRTADLHPHAGAIGSRTLSYDGGLLEAGGLVWREGVAIPVGRGLPESTTQYRSVRRVDYCSASSLLVRRTTWDAVGGFDDRYFPGYYEDVDLCLSIGLSGQDVLFEPRSQVRHVESGSLDSNSPYKAFASARSRAQFTSKWSDELHRFTAMATTQGSWEDSIAGERALLRARRLWRRVLVVDRGHCRASAVATRLASMVDGLAGRRLAVTLYAGDGTDPGGFFADRGVAILDGELVPHIGGAFWYDAVLFRRAADFVTLLPAVRALQPLAAVLYDVEDAATDVLALPQLSTSDSGSPLLRADLLVCATPLDASLLAMVPGRAPLAVVTPDADSPRLPGGPSSWAPVTGSWADIVTTARHDVLTRHRHRRRTAAGAASAQTLSG